MAWVMEPSGVIKRGESAIALIGGCRIALIKVDNV